MGRTKEPHTMDHLVVGQEYIFKEVKAPNGYLLAEDVHFVVEQTGKLQTIEMYDENVMGQITIRKTDANTDQGLKDAEFDHHRIGRYCDAGWNGTGEKG